MKLYEVRVSGGRIYVTAASMAEAEAKAGKATNLFLLSIRLLGDAHESVKGAWL